MLFYVEFASSLLISYFVSYHKVTQCWNSVFGASKMKMINDNIKLTKFRNVVTKII